MIYLSPLSDFGSWGMSAATFGALGFAAACSGFILRFAFASFATRRGNTEYRRPRNFLALFVILAFFLLSLEYLQGVASAHEVVYEVHLVSALCGGVIGVSLMARIRSIEQKEGRDPFRIPVY